MAGSGLASRPAGQAEHRGHDPNGAPPRFQLPESCRLPSPPSLVAMFFEMIMSEHDLVSSAAVEQ